MASSTRTRYAKSGGVDVAYQVLGDAPIDLLLFTDIVGSTDRAGQDVAEAAIAVIELRADTLRAMQLMGDPIPVSTDADAMTRFLGLTGRNPHG